MASPMPADADILGALQEPVRGRLSRAEDRDVSVVRPESQLCRANLTREPAAVRARCDPIVAALHDEDRRADRPRLKAPWRDVRQVVVHHPADAAFEGSPRYLSEPRPCPLERGLSAGVNISGSTSVAAR